MAQYQTVVGIIQFPPIERESTKGTLWNLRVRSAGSQKLINITVWPELQTVPLPQKGDFVCADGTAATRTYDNAKTGVKETSYDLSASALVINGQPVQRDDSRREDGGGSSSSDEDTPTF